MGMLIVHQRVKDFAAWKKVYDGHAPARKAAGLSREHVLQAADDPSQVTVVLDFAYLARAKAFAASDDLKDAMKRAGVTGKPELHILKKIT